MLDGDFAQADPEVSLWQLIQLVLPPFETEEVVVFEIQHTVELSMSKSFHTAQNVITPVRQSQEFYTTQLGSSKKEFV